jgi:hypothetical protein
MNLDKLSFTDWFSILGKPLLGDFLFEKLEIVYYFIKRANLLLSVFFRVL